MNNSQLRFYIGFGVMFLLFLLASLVPTASFYGYKGINFLNANIADSSIGSVYTAIFWMMILFYIANLLGSFFKIKAISLTFSIILIVFTLIFTLFVAMSSLDGLTNTSGYQMNFALICAILLIPASIVNIVFSAMINKD